MRVFHVRPVPLNHTSPLKLTVLGVPQIVTSRLLPFDIDSSSRPIVPLPKKFVFSLDPDEVP